MKDMRVMSGTNSHAFPTSSPLYFKHSVFVRDDHVAFIGCTEETKTVMQAIEGPAGAVTDTKEGSQVKTVMSQLL